MLSDLPWLPPPPPDFRERICKLREEAGKDEQRSGLWARVKALAAFSLDEVQLNQVARLVGSVVENGGPRAYKIALIGDGTLTLLGPAITASALRQDLRVTIIEGTYGGAVRDAIDPHSDLRKAEPDVVIVASDRRGLGLNQSTVSGQEARQAVALALGTVVAICEGLRAFVRGAIVLQTMVPPLEPFLGSFDLRFPR